MAGIAGVAVHPDARGQGLVRELLGLLLAESPEPVSVLFPTAPGIYRGLGYEVVGSLDWTPVPLGLLANAGGELRQATPTDLPALQELYAARGAAGSGWLARPAFEALLGRRVVTLAVEDGEVRGFVAYDRGTGYDGTAELTVWDCVASTSTALASLAGSLRSWDAVAGTALWRGSTSELALVVGSRLPAPRSVQPWMLRVLDPVAAVAARGFAGSGSAAFAVGDVGYRLEVASGRGQLTAAPGQGLVQVQPRGLALLFAGSGHDLARRGLSSAPVPGLEALCAGPVPEIVDYF
jgi:predicted acetyltransferase